MKKPLQFMAISFILAALIVLQFPVSAYSMEDTQEMLTDEISEASIVYPAEYGSDIPAVTDIAAVSDEGLPAAIDPPVEVYESFPEVTDTAPVPESIDIPVPAAETESFVPEQAPQEVYDIQVTETFEDITTESIPAEEMLYPVYYDYNANLYTPENTAEEAAYPGVYATAISPNTTGPENAPTIGIPSIADGNLPAPTTESPAIIQGAAVGFEEKTGPVNYTILADRVEPYTDFRYSIVEEQAADGTVHKKLTGFDGTYVIVRLDVSSLFAGGQEPALQYLHLKEEQNMALIPGAGMVDNNKGFADATGNKTGAYLLTDLVDTGEFSTGVPYIDIPLFSTGKLASGADIGQQTAPNGDVKLQFYVDETADYNPGLVYDPQSTDPNHAANVLAKFFDASKAGLNSISNYLLKGSDLALEVAVENSGGENKDTGTTYWSLKKAMEDPYYDLPADQSAEDPECGRVVELISEAPVVESITFTGTEEALRKRTLDLNSMDMQVANNSSAGAGTYTDFLTLENSWVTIKDSTNTTGAEVAIGNNARFVIDNGGKLIIDETCQLEIEWDGATTTPGSGEPQPAPDVRNNGSLDLRAGGEVVNNGIISIEGTEGKPYVPGQEPAADKQVGFGEMTIEEGATVTNNGALVVNGRLYNLGTLINNGSYNDLITSNDPDKGLFSYHKGIQLSWKDDVTQPNMVPGSLFNGLDRDGKFYPSAVLVNNGDILLNPGSIDNYSTLKNLCDRNIFLAAATEAIIPLEPTATGADQSKRITLDPPKPSAITNYGLILNQGNIVPAKVELKDDGSFGSLTVPGDHPELFGFPRDNNYGAVVNCGYIYGWDRGVFVGPGNGSRTVPKTGDSSGQQILLYLALMAVSLLCIIAAGTTLWRRGIRKR